MRRRALLAALPALALPLQVRAQASPLAGQLHRVDLEHAVVACDSLALLGARHGLLASAIARDNGLKPNARLAPGQRLRIATAHLLPDALRAGIAHGLLINLPQRFVWRLREGRVAAAYPIAAGKPTWPTPTGDFHVAGKQTDKTWIVPPSIQEEMRREGKPVLTRVPPGPDNPLGRHWIGLSLPGIGLHGTIAPASIYGFRSHGCMRLHPDDVAALYAAVETGEFGRIAYRPLLLAEDADGHIWAEANPDPYRRDRGTLAGLRAEAEAAGRAGRIDWTRVGAMLAERSGRAEIVG